MDYQEIYERHASEYDALVNAEDCDGNLFPALERIAPIRDRRVLEVGAGTGRITRLLVANGAQVIAVDRAPAMLEVARRHLEALSASSGPAPSGPAPADAAPSGPTPADAAPSGPTPAAPAPSGSAPSGSAPAGRVPSWQLLCADARDLPVASGWAEVAIAGWTFGHLRKWFPDDWRVNIQRALDEMARALKPGGSLIVVETLGTGSTEPNPPSEALAEYFLWLEMEQGMQRTAIRTDYRFADVDTAAATSGFFFGEAFAERVRREQWARVPECTGLWWKRV